MILDQIVSSVKKRLVADKQQRSLDDLKKGILKTRTRQGFYQSLSKSGISIIAEFKKASPSAGDIDVHADPVMKATGYEAAGASALSVLTERDHFNGCLEDLQKVTSMVNIPVLRKDFIIDPYQVYEAKTAGASAFLLIAAILTVDALNELIRLGHMLDLDALVEVHSEEEMEKVLTTDARIIGINNRDLKTFRTDLKVSKRLISMIPDGILSVSESGIRTIEDIINCQETGFDAVLIGEALMKSDLLNEIKKI